ncbi:hypothetical protein IAT40_006985 [Kwoniella sp. CBS 6097]
MPDHAPTYYDVLGVEECATSAEIRKAYLKLAARCHPDRNLDDPEAKEVFQEVQEAYETLYDAEAKAAYDEKLWMIRNPTPTAISSAVRVPTSSAGGLAGAVHVSAARSSPHA